MNVYCTDCSNYILRCSWCCSSLLIIDGMDEEIELISLAWLLISRVVQDYLPVCYHNLSGYPCVQKS